jgi:hypothetical protein
MMEIIAMAKICPQRVIKESARIIALLQKTLYDFEIAIDSDVEEEIDNNLLELDTLQKALYRDGIINIDE